MRRLILPLSTYLIILPAPSQAQGFGIYEQGTCAMSRGGATVAEPCDDGSALSLNPAGLTGGRRLVVGGGGSLILGSGSFTSDAGVTTKLDRLIAFPPHIYFTYRITERAAVGAGVYVPYGLRLTWPIAFSGRFVSYGTTLQTPYIQPTLAYALSESLSIGGGLTIAVGSVDLNRREDLARVPMGTIPGLTFSALVETETDFLDTALGTSRTTGIGANLGVAVRLHDRLRIGARYLTAVKLSYTGDVSFTPIAASYSVTKPNLVGLPVGTPLDAQVSAIQAAFENQPATTELTMPAQVIVGLSWRARENVTMFADYQWAGWSSFDTVTIDFSEAIPPDEQLVQSYRDTSALRLGVEISATRVLKIRGGYHGSQAAAPAESVTPILPEARRSRFATGLGWQLTPEAQTNDRPSVTLDVGYQFIHAADRRGRVVNPLPGELPNAALNSGMYQSRSNVIGVTVTYRR